MKIQEMRATRNLMVKKTRRPSDERGRQARLLKTRSLWNSSDAAIARRRGVRTTPVAPVRWRIEFDSSKQIKKKKKKKRAKQISKRIEA
jgi:hypothetical protein